MAYPYNGIFFCDKKELNTERCCNVDEPQERKEANLNRSQIVNFNVYEMSRICKYR